MKLNINRGIGIACLLALWASTATTLLAQQVEIEIQPRVIRLNETAILKLHFINTSIAQAPSVPAIEGFDVQYSGQESQFQFTNGSQERRTTYNYSLQPRASGKFTVGPFSLNLGNQSVSFEAVEVEVLPASADGSAAGSQTLNDLVFARLQLPRTNVYLQERFGIDLALYFRGIQLDRGVQLQNLPDTGLNVDNIEELQPAREAVNGEIYEVRRFRMRGTALTSGTFELSPSLQVNVLVRRERQRDPFFGGFDDVFFGAYEARPLSVPVEKASVTIRPLPVDAQPAGFGGAVGRFDMELQVQPRELTAGDPVTLTIRISGRGNLENISMPALALGDQFRTYDPKLIAADANQKIFEQVVIPRSDQITEIPAVAFSYFDPEAGAYQTISRGPEKLIVKAGASAPQLLQSAATGPALDRTPLGIDIVDIKRSARGASNSLAAQNRIDPWVHGAPLLALLALFGWRQHRDRMMQDISRQRRSQAPRSARAAIRSAEAALAAGDAGDFYQALWQAMADYFAHRCNLEAGQVSPDLILEKCRKGGMASGKVDGLAELIALLDEARFAQSSPQAQDMQNHLQQTQEHLRAMEKIRFG